MGVTLKQIADELNVSQPLVTYALNGKPGVSEQMRQRIIETADRLGYNKYSNREARLLAGKRHNRRVATGMIALIFPPWGNTPWTAVPYYRTLVDGVEFEVGLRSLDLVIAPYRSNNDLPQIVRERCVDGVIFLTNPVKEEQLEGLDLPVVGFSPDRRRGISVVPDDEAGIRGAIQHLVEMGHRSIAYLGPTTAKVNSAMARVAAFRNALQDHGIAANELLIQDIGDSSREDGVEAMRCLMQRAAATSSKRARGRSRLPFTAVVCHNDLLAMGAADYAMQAGLELPRDLSLTGFDDVSIDYNFSPALTSVNFSRFDMGRKAVEVVCELHQRWMANDSTNNQAEETCDSERVETDSRNHVFPTSLTIRRSTAPPSRHGAGRPAKNSLA